MLAYAKSALSAADFMTEGRWVSAVTPLGARCFKWLWTGMPQIPPEALKSTFYLYRNAEDARLGTDSGGTGFLVGVQIGDEDLWVNYAVTNWHVAVQRGMSVIRVNLIGGGTEIIDLGPEDWIFETGGSDIAITLFPFHEGQDVIFLPDGMLLSDEEIVSRNIAPGEDVFMVGRFVDAGGVESNEPAVRFGNISMMPVAIKQANGASPPSYALDMHSRSGFSGSPVFAYRMFWEDEKTGRVHLNKFISLLGIHWGQFPERWEIKTAEGRLGSEATAGEVSLAADKKYIDGLSGMTCVAPAAAIRKLLDHPKFKAGRDALERQSAARRGMIQTSVPVPEGPVSFGPSDRGFSGTFHGPQGGHQSPSQKPEGLEG